MKTLVNKNNPQIRITAPEIKVNIDTQTFYIGDEMFDMENWTLVWEKPLDLEKQKEQKPKVKSPLSPHELTEAKNEGIIEGRQDVIDNPERFGLQKPVEWSEEDKCNMRRIIRVLKDNDSDWEELIDWLKSLRPQSKNECSEEEPVDLEQEIYEYMSCEDNNPFDWDWRDKKACARHFYELGLNAKKEE